ncbi:hypothetical protein [Chlamydia suis]|uniref:hypothetical protein n=1 Tax=Chlamydia suis TaxID=83559 RepID=UPI001E486A13|nr:hypothetical protein [Chlamydia suis]MEB2689864.1 hypothetical protein [Chlamydia suis]
MFISFDKSHLEERYKPDTLEQIGNFLRFPVNRGIGSQVKILSLKSGHIFLSKKIISLCKRIACIALCVLLAPVCLLATLVGTLAYRVSNSYQGTLALFLRHQNMCVEVEKAMKGNTKEILLLQRNFRKVLEKKRIADAEKQQIFQGKEKPLVTVQEIVGKRFINEDKLKIAQEICDAIEKRLFTTTDDIERTFKNGTIVYTSKRCPGIEIREIGNKGPEILRNQEEIRKIITQQKLQHLTLPPVSIYKQFAIQEVGGYHKGLDSLIFYQKDPQKFDAAIVDLLKLFSIGYIPKLFETPKNLLEDLCYNKLLLQKASLTEKVHTYKRKSTDDTRCLAIVDFDSFVARPLPDLVEKMVALFPLHKELIYQNAALLGLSPKRISEGTPESVVKKMRHLFPQYREVIDQEKPLLQKLFKDPRSLDEIAARGKAFIKRILGDLSYFEEDALQNMHPAPKSNDMKRDYRSHFTRSSMFFLADRITELNADPSLLRITGQRFLNQKNFVEKNQVKIWESYWTGENHYMNDYSYAGGKVLENLSDPVSTFLLKHWQETKLALSCLEPDKTLGDLIVMRSPIIKKDLLLQSAIENMVASSSFLFKKPKNCSLSQDEFRRKCAQNLVEDLFDGLMELWVRMKIIRGYDPMKDFHNGEYCRIFY